MYQGVSGVAVAPASVAHMPAANAPAAAIATAPAVATAAYHAPVYATSNVCPSSKYSCSMCKQLVAPYSHKEEVCFINPRSPLFKPEIRARRLAAAVAKGLAIPQAVVN